MALDGLLALLCAGAIVTAGPAEPNTPANNPDKTIAQALAVQTALQQGRDQLLHGNYRMAVTLLEEQLPHINGNQVYLQVLQDAYRGYIRELRLARQDEEARRYLRRLLILDPAAERDAKVADEAPRPQPRPVAPAPPEAPPRPTVRAKADEDPFRAARSPAKQQQTGQTLLAEAEKAFADRRYLDARRRYEQACQADPRLVETCRERWAYCKLFHVVETLNQGPADQPPRPETEQEARQALELAPRLEFAKELLAEIQRRRNAGATPERGPSATGTPVQHYDRNASGWLVAESANFRVFHNQAPAFAEKVAQVAELTRANVDLKWLGAPGEAWSPKCDIYLHATAQDYSRATGVYNSPGHSTIKLDGGRLTVRRIDLHCEERNLVSVVLPHEATHIVIASGFGPQLVPRWADEGMAVLSEPHERLERHLANLDSCRQENQLFSLQSLMQMDQYPQTPRSVSAFYAQSASLVEFLTSRRDTKTFVLFLNEGQRYGYEKPLRQYYGYQNFSELEQEWARYAFSERGRLARLGGQGR